MHTEMIKFGCVEMMLILCHPFSMRTYLKYPGMLSLLSRFFFSPSFFSVEQSVRSVLNWS